ncbi:MAG TPA: glycoside hydrolase TIM-barrel-like domain-containing protein, partial [Devosiaceae bacterium]|nr:glycoside hydrolase TIM-barrel-like domain-containing protein [Devosiaceae bacterium]
ADGTYGEPWIRRYKDIVGWWSHAHHNRAGGVRAATPTAWVPQSKPIWFTELGCPAVDKGANEPNVFPDPKSTESARPYFSSGAPDALGQRQFLRAHLGWWRPDAPGFVEAHNPASTVYAGRMLDADRIYLWTWDARPFPAFPNDVDVWADGANYAAGHWLTGRLGALATDELVKAVASDYGVTVAEVDAAQPLIFGIGIVGMVSSRDALQPVLDASLLTVADGPDGLRFTLSKPRLAPSIGSDRLVDAEGPLASRKRPDPAEAVGRIALGYSDRQRDYLNGTATAMRLAGGASSGQNSPLVLDLSGARSAAERMLSVAGAARETLDVVLPPSLAALEVGDVVAIGGEGEGPFVITELRDSTYRKASLQTVPPESGIAIIGDRPLPVGGLATARAIPVVVAAHVPADPADPDDGSRLLLAGFASPWPGTISINLGASGAALASLTRSANLGELAAPLAPGPVALWDDVTELSVTLYNGHLASTDEASVLSGANRLAVETDGGEWEIIGFAEARLTAPATYVLTHLLRGQGGTGHAIGPAATGNRVLVLDQAVVVEIVTADWLGETVSLRAYAGRTDPTGTELDAAIDLPPDLPLAPVHLSACRNPVSGDIALAWVRCSRGNSDSWAVLGAPLDVSPEAYVVTILGTAPVRTISTSAPAVNYASADQIADFGSLPASFSFTIAQVSPVLGPGLTAQGVFNA